VGASYDHKEANVMAIIHTDHDEGEAIIVASCRSAAAGADENTLFYVIRAGADYLVHSPPRPMSGQIVATVIDGIVRRR
jgi:hypothetical protein